ncbi:MAG: DUF3131 domain-containing protein [Cyanobacteria bacterium P01_F01_bin.150]
MNFLKLSIRKRSLILTATILLTPLISHCGKASKVNPLETAQATPVSSPTPLKTLEITPEEAEKFCQATASPLTEAEEKYAKVAWQYFVNNHQKSTGFTNAAGDYPSGTLWDMGNYLMAMHSAYWLELIDQKTFDHRLNTFLKNLGELPLVDGALPNKVYNSATGEMVDYSNTPSDTGLGWSALDIGRFLTALHVIRTCHPSYADWMAGILSSWQLDRSVQDGQLFGSTFDDDGELQLVQEGRLGYEEYAARGYELWGFSADEALKAEPFELVDIEGIEIPVDSRDYESSNANNYVVSESYILDGIEFGFDGELAASAKNVFEVQKKRYESTGKLTAVSEDNVDTSPHFLYNTVYSNGEPWAVITEENEDYGELRSLSTKSAFGWHYLYPKDAYAQIIFNEVNDLYAADKSGFFAGIYEENNATNKILTGNTNGLILEILYYKARGNNPIVWPN